MARYEELIIDQGSDIVIELKLINEDKSKKNLTNYSVSAMMAPNYAAGKNMVAGVERTFKGKIVGKDLTKWGKDAQLDFSAELAKAKASGAEGIFIFYGKRVPLINIKSEGK